VAGRTNRPEIVQLARRIEATQADEIAFMRKWLVDRGQRLESAHAHHMMHDAKHMERMGMVTPQQMAAMTAASGVAFERQFLARMITHHEGAIRMANELLDTGGSAADPVLASFVQT
jgi:uncharacterized protein (DUF305 family)